MSKNPDLRAAVEFPRSAAAGDAVRAAPAMNICWAVVVDETPSARRRHG